MVKEPRKQQVRARKVTKAASGQSGQRFEPAKLESLFPALDAVAWMDAPTVAQVAQFAGIDPRTAGKLLKNAMQIGIVDQISSGYVMMIAYPYQGGMDQKKAAVQESLVRLPLLVSVRQFLKLGDSIDASLRKAATVVGLVPFNPGDLMPLVEWAQSLGALRLEVMAEDLVDAAVQVKERRHEKNEGRRVAFLSHSSLDKGFMRQLAADLTANGVDVWIDEQRIRVGESIPDKVAQGLAESDFFLIGVSKNSVGSEWVKKELNSALVTEVQRRHVHILPLKLDASVMPSAIADKRYADFSTSYKAGLEDLLAALRSLKDD